MSKININRVVVSGNLTGDPELRALPSGLSVCSLRLANNTRRKDSASGEWANKPNFFTITVFRAQAENAARYLSKGSGLTVDGRLDWREWEAPADGGRRQAVEIIADTVEFMPDGKDRSKDRETDEPDASGAEGEEASSESKEDS
jgi:single-strand DNA-binding protein